VNSCSGAPSSTAAADQAKRKGEGKSKGEYLAYSARLKPRHSKHLCNSIKMDKRGCIVDFAEKYKGKGEFLSYRRLASSSDFLQHEIRISQQFISTEM
jgi:hypothetical protein